MALRIRDVLVAGAVAALALGGGAAVAMGGGSDSAPSASAPAYDPAEDFMKGVASLNAGRYKEAARALARVTGAVPKNAEAWRLLGQAQAGQANPKGARRAYERAVKLEPDDIDAHQGLGEALASLKDAKATAELDWLVARAVACGGSCPDAERLRKASAAVQAAIAGGGPSAALDGGQLLFAAPEAGDRAYLGAVGLIHEQRFDEALAALDRAREAFGPHPDVLTYQGYAWRRKGDLALAETYYRQALAVAPKHLGAMEYYGELMVERRDMAGARRMLARLDRACRFGCAEAEELRRWIDAGGQPLS